MLDVQIVNFLVLFISVAGRLLFYALLARVILSWLTPGAGSGGGRFSRIVHDLTEPVIRLVRLLPHRIGMIDFAPLIAMIGIELVRDLLIRLIYYVAGL